MDDLPDTPFPFHARQVVRYRGNLHVTRGQFLKWLDAFSSLMRRTKTCRKFLHFVMVKTEPSNGGYYVLQQVGKAGRRNSEYERAITSLSSAGLQLTSLSDPDWLYDETKKRYPAEIAGWIRVDSDLSAEKRKHEGHESDTDEQYLYWVLKCFALLGECSSKEILIYQ